MSPEEMKMGQGEYSTASDVYGLGCVLFEMLVGTDEFRAVAENCDLEHVAPAVLEASEKCNSFDDNSGAIRVHLKTLCLQMLANEGRLRPSVHTILTNECLRESVAALIHRAPCLQRVLSIDEVA